MRNQKYRDPLRDVLHDVDHARGHGRSRFAQPCVTRRLTPSPTGMDGDALMTSHADYWTTAQLVCTKKQLAALSLRDTLDLSERQIAHVLGVSRGTIRDHLDAADRKITHALKETAA